MSHIYVGAICNIYVVLVRACTVLYAVILLSETSTDIIT